MKKHFDYFGQLTTYLCNYNKSKGVRQQYADASPLACYVVFIQDKAHGFDKDYSEPERTYKFTSDNKLFIYEMMGSSVFAESLEGGDYIRLDYYVDNWKIEDIYIELEESEKEGK